MKIALGWIDLEYIRRLKGVKLLLRGYNRKIDRICKKHGGLPKETILAIEIEEQLFQKKLAKMMKKPKF